MTLTATQIKQTIRNHRASHLLLANAYKKRADEARAQGNKVQEEARIALWKEHLNAAHTLEELIIDLQEAEGQNTQTTADQERAVENF